MTSEIDQQNSIKMIFDRVSELYDRVRPGYSRETIDRIVEIGRMDLGSTVLEIGAGTGQMTLPMVQRGFDVIAIEPGKNMADILRRKLHAYSNVKIAVSSFEEWVSESPSFDLVLSAQAFHWLDQESSVRKSAQILKSDGSLILLWHVDASQDTEFYRRTGPIYREFLNSDSHAMKNSLPDRIGCSIDVIRRSSLFGPVQEERHLWEKVYSGEDYLRLIGTFSDHASLPEPSKNQFFKRIEEVIRQTGGSVLRKYMTRLIHTRTI